MALSLLHKVFNLKGRVRNEFQNFIGGLGKSVQLSMRKLQEGSLYIAIALYFLCYCSWGSRPALFSGCLRPSKMPGRPNSRGRLSLNLYIRNKCTSDPQRSTKKGKTDGGEPRPKKYQRKKSWEEEEMMGVWPLIGSGAYVLGGVGGLGLEGGRRVLNLLPTPPPQPTDPFRLYVSSSSCFLLFRTSIANL